MCAFAFFVKISAYGLAAGLALGTPFVDPVAMASEEWKATGCALDRGFRERPHPCQMG
jgi:hypothetical protein